MKIYIINVYFKGLMKFLINQIKYKFKTNFININPSDHINSLQKNQKIIKLQKLKAIKNQNLKFEISVQIDFQIKNKIIADQKIIYYPHLNKFYDRNSLNDINQQNQLSEVLLYQSIRFNNIQQIILVDQPIMEGHYSFQNHFYYELAKISLKQDTCYDDKLFLQQLKKTILKQKTIQYQSKYQLGSDQVDQELIIQFWNKIPKSIQAWTTDYLQTLPEPKYFLSLVHIDFSCLKQLKIVKNMLNNIQALSWMNIPNITLIDISQNYICSLKVFSKLKLKYLSQLYFQSNQIVSSHQYAWMSRMKARKDQNEPLFLNLSCIEYSFPKQQFYIQIAPHKYPMHAQLCKMQAKKISIISKYDENLLSILNFMNKLNTARKQRNMQFYEQHNNQFDIFL